jgi:hypothetical protein
VPPYEGAAVLPFKEEKPALQNRNTAAQQNFSTL